LTTVCLYDTVVVDDDGVDVAAVVVADVGHFLSRSRFFYISCSHCLIEYEGDKGLSYVWNNNNINNNNRNHKNNSNTITE